jgi:hypothetical protein
MNTDVIEAEFKPLAVQAEAHLAPSSLFESMRPAERIALAGEMADVLKDVLDKKGLIVKIPGKNGAVSEHVKAEGWQTCGALCGVSARVVSTTKTANGYEARAEAVRLDNGVVVGGGEAVCTKDEKRWSYADEYAIKSMAQTRAISKALRGVLAWVIVLAGYNPTPAEEVPPGGFDAAPRSRPAAAPQGNPDDLADAYTAQAARTRPAPRNAPESTRRPDATATDPAKGANSEHPGTGDRVVRPELNPAAGRAPEPAPLNAEADAKKRRALRTSIVVNSRVLWPDKAECETNRHLAERLHRVTGLGDDVIDSVPMEALESLQRDIQRRSNGHAEATARTAERDDEDAIWASYEATR